MEDYYRSRLRRFSQARVHKPRLILESLVRKAAYIRPGDIVHVDDVYLVPSEKNANVPIEDHKFYTVNCNLGTCTCDAAKSGQFCKHQAAVWTHNGAWTPSMPPTSSEDRYQMAVLALGENAEDISFYADFQQSMESQAPSIERSNENASCSSATRMSVESPPEVAQDVTPNGNSSNFREVVEKMCQFNERFQSAPAATAKILKRLNHVTTATQWNTFLQTQGAGVSCVYRSGSTIHVQPTALSRRRPGITRGSKRIASGRPPLNARERFRLKRHHGLSRNIALIQPNAT